MYLSALTDVMDRIQLSEEPDVPEPVTIENSNDSVVEHAKEDKRPESDSTSEPQVRFCDTCWASTNEVCSIFSM